MSASPSLRTATPDMATLTDAAGTRQAAGFFGSPGSRTFGVMQLPERPVACVVICPALHSDFERTYRRDVLLGRALAAEGVAVHRFHYRGLGNSEGVSSAVTFESMCEDAVAAAHRLRLSTGVSAIGFVGTRWGGLIAAAAAEGFDRAPVALWDPTTVADAYFREAGRARAVRDAKDGRPTVPWSALVEQLRSGVGIDALGYQLEPALYHSAVHRTLVGELGSRPRPVLLVQLDRSDPIRRAYGAIADGLRVAGFEAEHRSIEGEAHWWFIGGFWEPVETRPSTGRLLEETTGWMTGWLRRTAGP